MRTTLRVAAAALVASLFGWSLGAAPQPGAQPTIQFNTASGAHDSTNLGEPFAIQVNMPQVNGPMPATMQVTLSNGKGQDQTITVTQYQNSNIYVSQTITVEQGAQRTGAGAYLPGGLSRSVDPVKVDNGGTMSASLANGMTTNITVYQNASKQAIARNLASMDARSEELSRIATTARDGVTAIDQQLKTETDPGVRSQLQKARAELVKQRDIATRESAALGEGRRLMQEPEAQDLPMWRYTDQFKLAISTAFLPLSKDPNVSTHDWSDAYDRAARIAQMQWDDIYQQFVIDYARGWYEATASLSLAGPTMTLFGGKTIYWKDATLGERLSAFKDLAVAFAMIKGLPKVVDITGEKLAGELGGYKGNTAFGEIVITNGGGGSRAGEVGRAGATVEPGRGAAPEGGVTGKPAPDLVVNTALSEAAHDSFNRAAEQARATGLADGDVRQIVDDTMANVDAAKEGQPKIDALAKGELDLADRLFETKYPGRTAISDVETLQLIRTVRVKAALEAQGKAQTWTSAEKAMLDSLNTPAAQSAFELEDPFGLSTGSLVRDRATTMNGLDASSEPGYTPLLDDADVKNISQAAKKPLKVVDTAPDPVVQQKLKDFRAKQAAKTAPKATGETGRTGAGDTQVLRPGEIKNTVGPKAGSPVASGNFQLGKLRDLIVARRLQTATRAQIGRQSPLADRTPSGQKGGDAATPEKIKTLTPDELRKITPQEIRDMSPEAREALPLERMNGPQLRAIAEADGIPTGQINTATGLEGAAGGAAGPSQKQQNEENNRKLGDIGRLMVGDDPPKKTASSGAFGMNPIGSVALNPNGSLFYQPFVAGETYAGTLGLDGTITITGGPSLTSPTTGAPDLTGTPTGTFVFAPSPISGVYTGLGGSTVVQFPAPGFNGITTPLVPVGTGSYFLDPPQSDPNHEFMIFIQKMRELRITNGAPATGMGQPRPYTATDYGPEYEAWLQNWTQASQQNGTTTGGVSGNLSRADVNQWIVRSFMPTPAVRTGTVPPSPGDPFGTAPQTGPVSGFFYGASAAIPGKSVRLIEVAPDLSQTDISPENLMNVKGYVDPHGDTFSNLPPGSITLSDGLTVTPIWDFSALSRVNVLPGVQDFFGLLAPMNVAPVAPQLSAGGLWSWLRALVDPRAGALANRTPWSRPAMAGALGLGSQGASTPVDPRNAVKAVFVSTGIATGEAFQVTAINDGARPISLQADGVVLEPVASGGADQARKQMQDAIKKRGSKAPAPTVAMMSGYCLDYIKEPPTAGSLFRIASPEVQAKFAPLRRVLQAEERLEQLGRLVPDLDPAQYFHQLRQWALWSQAQGFTPETFAKEFVDHARKNILAAKQPWTKQIESQIANLVPHRWQEITMVLQQAQQAAGK